MRQRSSIPDPSGPPRRPLPDTLYAELLQVLRDEETIVYNPATGRYENGRIAIAAATMEQRVRDAVALGDAEDLARARLSQERWWSLGTPGVTLIGSAARHGAEES